MIYMCTYFKTEVDVAQNLIDDFFSNFEKKWSTGLISLKTESL